VLSWAVFSAQRPATQSATPRISNKEHPATKSGIQPIFKTAGGYFTFPLFFCAHWGVRGSGKNCLDSPLIHLGITTPCPNAPMGALIPGCQVAPFAFTVSPVGSKIDEKIFEKRSISCKRRRVTRKSSRTSSPTGNSRPGKSRLQIRDPLPPREKKGCRSPGSPKSFKRMYPLRH
jgi:hypothetical protein